MTRHSKPEFTAERAEHPEATSEILEMASFTVHLMPSAFSASSAVDLRDR